MAEFCLDCYNKLNGTQYTNKDVTLDEDFCEGCGELKPCVVDLQPAGFFSGILEWIKNIGI